MGQLPLITVVFGTRPEAIKLAPLIIKLRDNPIIRLRVICSGQHKDMIRPIMNIFEIVEDDNFEIMKKKQTLNYLIIETIKKLEEEFTINKPDLVLVQGDTSTAFATALCAFNNGIKVGHIEAGLRTNNLLEPFPEEGNRRLITQIAELHFAPTELSKKNLIDSNIKDNIFVTGNTVIDSLFYVSNKNKEIDNSNNLIYNKEFILATIHRRENWGKNLNNICKGLKLIAESKEDLYILLPMHPNQIIRDKLVENLGNCERIILTGEMPYDKFVDVMGKCRLVITDSGGLQEEAPSLCKPVLILRNFTERTEAIDAGTAKLIGTSPSNIFKETNILLENESVFRRMANAKNPFGDGLASLRIMKKCLKEIL